MNGKIIAVFLMVLFFIPALPILNHITSAATTTTTEAQGFQIIGAQWGASSATNFSAPITTAEAGPGVQDLPLTLTLQYIYPYRALYAQLDIQLPSGFSANSPGTSSQSGNNSTVYYANSLTDGQVFEVQTYLNLANNVSIGTYTFPTSIIWSAVLTNSTNSPQVNLEQNTHLTVRVEGNSKLTFATSESGLISNQINDITLVLTNSGSGSVSNIETTITSSSPQTVSVLNQIPETSELGANSSVSYAVELFVASSAAGSSVSLSLGTTYLDAYTNSQSVTQSLGLFVASSTAAPTLVYRSFENSLTPGQVNNITLSATNEGNVPLSAISTQVTSPSGSVSVLTQPEIIQSLTQGDDSSFNVGLFVSGSASNTPVTLTISATYTITGPNNTGSVTQTIGLYVSSQQSASGNSSISVSTLSNVLQTGQQSLVSFQIKNGGSVPIYYPSLSLTVASPLVVTANSSFAFTNDIPANGTVVYEAMILTSPSSTIGVYDGTLSINYSNQYGIANSQSVAVGFVLTGTIDLIIQDETITSSSGNLTVSGTLLNEGTASAYYASVAGSLNSNSSSRAKGPVSYIGEIDPNTPVPFTTTVPYTSATSSRQTLTLAITYKDSFGNNLTAKSPETTTIPGTPIAPPSTGTTTSTSGAGVVVAVFYAIIIIVVVAVIAGVVLVRRRRRVNKVDTEDSKVV